MFEKNIGQTDKIARIIVGVLALAGFFLNWVAAPWSYVLLLIALAMFFTVLTGSCLLYTLLGIRTNKK